MNNFKLISALGRYTVLFVISCSVITVFFSASCKKEGEKTGTEVDKPSPAPQFDPNEKLVCPNKADEDTGKIPALSSEKALSAFLEPRIIAAASTDAKDPGREALFSFMKGEPLQLVRDFKGTMLSDISISNEGPDMYVAPWRRKPPSVDVSSVSVCNKYELVNASLKEYIKSLDPSLLDEKQPDMIGKFNVLEIIYAIAQTFSSAPNAEYAFWADPEFAEKYGTPKDDPTNTVTHVFSLANDKKELTVTNKTSKRVVLLINPNPSKVVPVEGWLEKIKKTFSSDKPKEPEVLRLDMTGQVIFNLATGSVTYTYEETFNGQKKGPWTGVIKKKE